MPILDPRRPDPFEPYHAIHRSLRWWQWNSAALLVLTALSLGWGVLMASRPPVVIVKDRVHGEPATISLATHAPEVTIADARAFLVSMVRLRFGWDSLTVQRDMETFRRQCYRDHRVLEDEHLRDLVSVDAEHADAKIPRLHWWVQQSVRNTLVLPDSLDAIDCIDKEDMFHCTMQASLVTQSLLTKQAEQPAVQRMIFVGTFLRVPHRIETPYGLIVGALRALPADSMKGARG